MVEAMGSLEIMREELCRWGYHPFHLQVHNCESIITSPSIPFKEWFARLCIRQDELLEGENSLWKLDPPPLNGVQQYGLEDLKRMTDNFSEKHLIKETMHGRLFRGFTDNREVTIKTWDFFCPFKPVYTDHHLRFCNEIEMLIDENRHPTLMKLKGFCFKQMLAVVYDEKYDEKTTMFLLEELYSGMKFGWDARMKVATQLASLFSWLHEKGMTFGKAQASTIMIKEDLDIKVFDFGFLYRVNEDVSGSECCHHSSHAPETVNGVVQTKKSDVYSFGFLLLELIAKEDYLSRRKNNQKLDHWSAALYDGCDIRPIMEPSLLQNKRQTKMFNKRVVACLQKDPNARPDMKDVSAKLDKLALNLGLEKEDSGNGCKRRRKSHKAKGTMTEAAQSIQKWTPEEECLLASAWVDVSEHPVVGSKQTKDGMWDRIEEKFFTAMKKDGSYRTRDQLTSKWGHINRKVRKFIGVYEECARSQKSGTNDVDVLRLATTRYQDDEHQGKVPIDFWRILSHSPKWQQLNNPDDGSSKKRSSVYAEVEVDDTIGLSEQMSPFGVADSDDEDPIPRPIGRKKAKSIASGSGGIGSDFVSSREEIGRAMVEQLRVFNLREEERMKLKEQEMKRKEQEDEIKIMETDLSTLLGFKRMIYEQRQREIKAKYNLP